LELTGDQPREPDPGKLRGLVRLVLAHLERQPEPGAALTREPPRRAQRASGRLAGQSPSEDAPPDGQTRPDDAR
jgi:hypothetical protein